MLPSPTLSPHDASDLRFLLNLRSSTDSRCHGSTQARAMCKIGVAAANAVVVDAALEKAAQAATIEEKIQILMRIAPKVLCQKYHQYQQPDLIAEWIGILMPLCVSVKTEPIDEINLSPGETHSTSDRRPEDSRRERKEASTLRRPKTEPQVKVEPVTLHREARLGRSREEAPQERTFKPYCARKSTRGLNTLIKTILSKPLTPAALSSSLQSGYVYVYTFTPSRDTPIRYLKIGYSTDYNRRLKSWERKCGTKPRLLCHYETKHYRTVERIVHAHLANQRLLEEHCEGCGGKHKEWFEVRLSEVSNVLGLWTEWSWREPWDEDGLLKREWVRRLEDVNLGDPDCWKDFLED
ncbi:hypothetical protein LIA77_01525 [Sarocladium implicatum]|nr:hypothetical protein LIA77_01525 [Sarocladium implicatum]